MKLFKPNNKLDFDFSIKLLSLIWNPNPCVWLVSVLVYRLNKPDQGLSHTLFQLESVKKHAPVEGRHLRKKVFKQTDRFRIPKTYIYLNEKWVE